MSSVVTTFPDSTYTAGNKPSAETLKTDIQALETGHNDLQETAVLLAGTQSITGTKTMSALIAESPVIKAWSGWQLYAAVTPTRASADAPTYVLTFAAVDLTSIMSVGMKVKFTQSAATVYGIITALSYSTNTTMTIYCGTDYSVADTASAAISNFYFSTDRTPQGFPMDPTKWTVEASDTTQRSQSSPVQNTWYNLGSITISIPIGIWDVYYKVSARGVYNSNTSENIYSTLSTANNSESDVDFTAYTFVAGASGNISGGMTTGVRKTLVIAAKTSYYLNHKTNNTSQTTLVIENAESKCIVRAVCAYL